MAKSISISTLNAVEHRVQLNYNAPQIYYIGTTPPNKRNLSSANYLSLCRGLLPYSLNMGMSVDSQKKHANLNTTSGNAFNCVRTDWLPAETPTYDQWYGGINNILWGIDFNIDLYNLCKNLNCEYNAVLGLSSTIAEAEYYVTQLGATVIYCWDEVLGNKTPEELLSFGTSLVIWRNAFHQNVRLVFWADIVYKDQSRPVSALWRASLQKLQKLLNPIIDTITQYSQTNDRVAVNASNPLRVPNFIDESNLTSHAFTSDNVSNLKLINDYYNVKVKNDLAVLAFEYPNYKIDFAETETEDNFGTNFIKNKMMGGYDIGKKAEVYLQNHDQINSIVYQQLGNLIVGGNGHELPDGISYKAYKMIAPLFYEMGKVKKICQLSFTDLVGVSGECIQEDTTTYKLLINNQSDQHYRMNRLNIDGKPKQLTFNVSQIYTTDGWDGEIIENYATTNIIEIQPYSIQTFTFQPTT